LHSAQPAQSLMIAFMGCQDLGRSWVCAGAIQCARAMKHAVAYICSSDVCLMKACVLFCEILRGVLSYRIQLSRIAFVVIIHYRCTSIVLTIHFR